MNRPRRSAGRFRGPRIIVNLLLISLVSWAFVSLDYPLPGQARILEHFSRLDPLTGLAVWLGQGKIQAWFAAGLGLLVLTLLLGRFFCTWLCPFGAITVILDEIVQSFHKRRRKRPPVSVKPAPLFIFLNRYRYIWPGALLLLIIAGSYWPLLLTPSSLMGHEIRQLLEGTVPYVLILVIVIGLLSFPRFWCTYLCPTGLLLTAAGRWRRWGFRLSRQLQSLRLVRASMPGICHRPRSPEY